MAPHSLRWPAWALLAVVALSGCASNQTTTLDAGPATMGDAPIAPGLGRLVGVVTDEELIPVEGATVELDDNAQVISAPDGAYRFDRVEPGPHILFFSAALYEANTVQVEVSADEVTTVAGVSLKYLGADAPYFATQQSAGFDTCSVTVGTPVLTQGWPLCEPEFLTTSFEDLQTFHPYWVDSLLPISGFWGESEWQATQVLGDSMRAAYLLHGEGRVDSEDKLAEMYIAVNSAPSPNRVAFTRDDVYNATNGVNNIDNALTCSREGPCQIIAWHHAAPSENTAGTLGFQFQQRYDHYLTAFYNTPLPVEFTVLADS